MKKFVVSGLMVLCLAGMVQAAIITTGTGPTFVYQKDVSSDKDGNSLMADTQYNGLQWFDNTDKAWIGQNGIADDRYMTFHFQAPAGYTIQSAQVFTRRYLRDDHWETVSLKATWGTVTHAYPWDYLYQDTQFYYRQNGSGVWTDESTATLPVGGAQDLYLTFATYQSGYAAMDWSKEWFVSPDTAAYDPGLIVTLNIVPEPVTLALLSLGGLLLGRRK